MDLARQTFSVFAVLGLLVAAVWWLRRAGVVRIAGPIGRGRTNRRLESVERLVLTPQHSLHLIRIGERTILVAVSPSSCSVLEREVCD